MKVIFVSGAYSGDNAWEIEQNVRKTEALSLQVAEAGAAPDSLNVLGRFWNGTLPYEFWIEAALAKLRKADAVLFALGYSQSYGATREEDEAIARGQTRLYSIEQLRAWLLENP